jgi:hypothetical protein
MRLPTPASEEGGPRLPGMDVVRMVASCALDETGQRLQSERYRRAGEGAQLVERARRRLVVDLDAHIDNTLVDEMITVERACCPFLTLGWEPDRRRLTVSASLAEHEAALDAIAFALDIATPAQRIVRPTAMHDMGTEQP